MSATGKNIYAQLESDKEEIEFIVSEASNGNWAIVTCVFCGRKMNILDADYSTGDPACKHGCG